MNNKSLLLIMVSLVFTMVASTAEAIPAFARKYNTNCSSCHSAMPQLNSRGRGFKEAGYAFPQLKGESTISDFLHIDKYFPVSAMIKARPYDKKDSGDEKLRAIHEIELFIAGRMYKKVSGIFELEAEDETDFNIEVPHAALTYNHSDELNFRMAYSQLMGEDPYDTYADARRLTRGHASVVDQAFGGADDGGKLRTSRQSVSVHGRPMDNLFYSVGYAGLANDKEGVNPGVLYGRLAYDVMPDVMVGLLAVSGKCETSAAGCAVERDFSRVGVDMQADINDFRLMGVFMKSKDDNAGATAEEKNDAWYLQAQYMFKDKGRPKIVPMIRLDNYEKANGVDEYKELTLNLGYYFTQNIRGYIEYWDRFDVPAGQLEDDRITLQLDAAF